MPGGKIVLAGGHELRPGCEEMDRRVLQDAGGRAARVVFLPTAVARYDPVGSGRGAVAYFKRLGVHCEVAMILSRADADRQEMVRLIEAATLVFMGGGDPPVLLEALRGSPAWEAILRAYERGAVVGGASAGAMVVCGRTLLPGKRTEGAPPEWGDGLGLVPNALVLPHFGPSREARRRRAGPHAGAHRWCWASPSSRPCWGAMGVGGCWSRTGHGVRGWPEAAVHGGGASHPWLSIRIRLEIGARMRILLVTPYYKPAHLGGIERAIERLAGALHSQSDGDQVGVLTTHYAFPPRYVAGLPAHEVLDGWLEVYRLSSTPHAPVPLFPVFLPGHLLLPGRDASLPADLPPRCGPSGG